METPDPAEKTTRQIAAEMINEVSNPPPEKPATPPPSATPPPVTPPTKLEVKPTDDKKPTGFDMTSIEIPAEALGEKKENAAVVKTPDPEPEPDEIKNAGQKTRHAFAELRTRLAQVQEDLKKARETKQPIPGAASTDQIVAQTLQTKQQVEELQTKLDQAYDQLGKFSLQADPRFRARYEGPQNAILEQIKETVKEWDVKDEDVAAFLKATPKERVALINEKAPDMMPILTPLFAQYDHIERLKQMDLGKHKEIRQALDNDQIKNRAIADQTGREALFKQAATKVLQDGHFVLRPIEGQEEWNKGVAVLHQKVNDLFHKDDPLAQSEALILGVTAPIYLALFKKERAQRIDLEKQLEKRYGIKPGLDGKVSPEPARDDKNGITSADAVRNVLREEMNQ
jgi:hypothetical protein